MFIKPFKVKSNVQLKGSETKKLKLRLQQTFENLSEENVAALIPNKAMITFIKIITHGGYQTSIYAVDKRPMFFEDENNAIVPSLYTLWIVPDLLPYFTTQPAVLPRLGNGADLMLPGVIPRENGMYAYGNYKKNQLVAVNLTCNKAAVGIGRLFKCSHDLYMSGGYGTCVKMLHVFGDKLWGIEPSVTQQIPDLESVVSIPKDDDFPELGSSNKKTNPIESVITEQQQKPQQKQQQHQQINDNIENDNDIEKKIEDLIIDGNNTESSDKENLKIENDKTSEMKNSMDEILKSAFLTALKYDKKNLSLPLLTSNFYRLHVIPAAGKQIDLKQTSYKKFSKFLNEMSDKGIIIVREETKGVEKITSVDFDHPDIVNFIPGDHNSDNNKNDNNSVQLFHSQMMELYLVTDETISFFAKLSYRKGDGISSLDVKKLLKEYVSKNHLMNIENTKNIKLDQTLSDICKMDACTLDDLHRTVISKMDHTYEMRAKNESSSSNKTPIQMSLATRSGNKKVTLVSNLEAYGIIIPEFAKACKLGAAASTTLIKTPHQKQMQLQIQGNQIRFLYTLLTETYKIPPRQINGLDLAKKEKKKKN